MFKIIIYHQLLEIFLLNSKEAKKLQLSQLKTDI